MQPTETIEVGSHESAILVFPATHPAGRDFVEVAQERGEKVIAASSVLDAELEEELGHLLRLPHVHEPDFPSRFLELLETYRVSTIYAPVAVVYSWLDKFIRAENIPVRLIGESPVKREMSRFNRLMERAGRYKNFIDDCTGGRKD